MSEDLLVDEQVSKPEAVLSRLASRAMTFAVTRSDRAALIDTSEAGMSQDGLVAALPSYYHTVSVVEIIDGRGIVPLSDEKSGLVVTGYSGSLEREDRLIVEQFVRGRALRGNRSERGLSILVLSDSMPDGDAFVDPNRPWYNGPFSTDRSVWSMENQDSGPVIELTQYESRVGEGYVGGRRERAWVVKERHSFSD